MLLVVVVFDLRRRYPDSLARALSLLLSLLISLLLSRALSPSLSLSLSLPPFGFVGWSHALCAAECKPSVERRLDVGSVSVRVYVCGEVNLRVCCVKRETDG